MADLRAGDEISTEYWPPAVKARDDTSITNQTSTSYIPGSPENGVAFVAPVSGRVGLIVAGDIRQNDSSDRIFMTCEVYEGDDSGGTEVLAASAFRGISTSGQSGEAQIHGNMSQLDGLTAGDTYFIRSVFRVEGGSTNDVFSRSVTVIPLP